MINFNKESFQKFSFTDSQIDKYFKSAMESLHIAETVKISEVIFKFSYEALLKLCITVIAKAGYKVRSNKGHHIKILETASALLKDLNIKIIGNSMRLKRNMDLYSGGTIISEKQNLEYLKFVQTVLKETKFFLNG